MTAARTPLVEGVDQPGGGETPSGVSQGVPDWARKAPPKIELSDEDKALLEEARLAQLMTDDPLAYEQEMIDANLNQRMGYGDGEDARRAESDL